MLHSPTRIAAVSLLSALFFSANAAAEFDVEEAQDLYREYCRPCHTDGSPAGKYNPTTLIQSQWVRFFDRKYERKHKGVTDPNHGGQAVTAAISAEDLEKIRWFAVEHAADTEQPMTCDD